MSRQVTRLVTSRPALTQSAAALRIPTIKTKIVTVSPAATCSLQRAPRPTSPPTMEKTGGLFDLEIDKTDLGMENNVDFVDSLFTFDFESTPKPTKKTFAEKLREANLHINTAKEAEDSALGTPMNLDLDDTDLAHLLTPGTEALTLQLLQTGPEPAVDQLLSSVQDDTSSDHQYAAGLSKRRLSSTLDDTESVFSGSDAATPRTKAKRSRGIYRADDVTNEAEMANYLERRRKNNASSKMSRANKKTYYQEMEAKSRAIAADNKRLEAKMRKLEKINQVMKDFLKDAFVGNLK